LKSDIRGLAGLLCPQPSSRLSCISFILPELLNMFEWESCVSKTVPLLDDLSIQECAVIEIDIGK